MHSSDSLSIFRYLPKEKPATNVDDNSNFSLGRAAAASREEKRTLTEKKDYLIRLTSPDGLEKTSILTYALDSFI